MNPAPGNNFRALTVIHQGRTNRIVTEVTLFPAFDFNQTPNPGFPGYKTMALWDTGATGSVITGATAQAMQLAPVGKSQVNHAGGTSEHNNYLINLLLPNDIMTTVRVIEAHDIKDNFGAIIGMDIITQGDFAITNVNGETCMTFRVPSIATIDYVVEGDRLRFSGVNRNAPCPCGSGKKFKVCHGRMASHL